MRQRAATLWCALLAAAMFCSALQAQSQLVTIQDTLFMADGIRFKGTLLIRWNTFDTNSGTIVQQSRSVTVSNGNLQVQLTANATAPAPANSYSVTYQSDGREQFTESWTVPQVSRTLKVAEVRTGTFSGSNAGGSGSVGNQTPIPESTVIGLVADLAQRPIKGPGFGTGSVAVINQSGQIETAAGNIGDCVYVDGTTGACGAPAPQFYDAETPGGLVDGTNTTFTLANPPSGSSLQLFRNGMYMKAGFDYTLTNSTIEFINGATPQPQDTLVASYRIDPNAGNIGNLESGNIGRRTVMAQVLCSSSGRTNGINIWTSLGACDIPAAALRPGDRFEIRFNFSHTGTNSGFDVQILWGTTGILLRHGSTLDAAVVGRSEASLSTAGAQITTESWGTVLPLLPGIVSSNPQNGLKIDFLGKLDATGTDSLGLSYTILRYPSI